MAEPVLPPTWKKDCAKPCFPPEAIRATRDDSGWKTAEPMPMSAAARSSKGKVGAIAEQQQADEGEDHADGKGVGHGLAVGVMADDWLKEGRGDLEGEGDEADLSEVEMEG